MLLINQLKNVFLKVNYLFLLICLLIKCAKLNLIKMSKNSKLNVLGVMTGTSMDGVDISLIKTKGTDFVKIKCETSFKFDKIIKIQ